MVIKHYQDTVYVCFTFSSDQSKHKKYWLATNFLHFNVRFVADFFYNVRPILYPGFYILILGSENEELINRL